MIYTLEAIFKKGVLHPCLPEGITLPEGTKLYIHIEIPEKIFEPTELVRKLNEVYEEKDQLEQEYIHKMRKIYRRTLKDIW